MPFYAGKQQAVTYDTVKENIIQQIQKTFKYGLDMVKAIRDDAYKEPGGGKPVRRVVPMG